MPHIIPMANVLAATASMFAVRCCEAWWAKTASYLDNSMSEMQAAAGAFTSTACACHMLWRPALQICRRAGRCSAAGLAGPRCARAPAASCHRHARGAAVNCKRGPASWPRAAQCQAFQCCRPQSLQCKRKPQQHCCVGTQAAAAAALSLVDDAASSLAGAPALLSNASILAPMLLGAPTSRCHVAELMHRMQPDLGVHIIIPSERPCNRVCLNQLHGNCTNEQTICTLSTAAACLRRR
jgi:hypothetical protein